MGIEFAEFMKTLEPESIKENSLPVISKIMPEIFLVTSDIKKKKYTGIIIKYAFQETKYGTCFIGIHPKGICELALLHNEEEKKNSLQMLAKKFSGATLIEEKIKSKSIVEKIFQKSSQRIRLYLVGTAFQLEVWQGLLKIPFGTNTTYENIARLINRPKALRATGTAIGANPIAYLIPCHRVINKNGEIGNYRWGKALKTLMIAEESIY